ncbi:hypothetical protein [Halobacillus sp. H74]|uniref:hypothetical protein n=1 Tax=Halobacillus sp. H74 TaxID=3457436 RepID=UPI003FCD418F
MFSRENIININEISFLDSIFHLSGYRDLSNLTVRKDVLVKDSEDHQNLDSLRAKGVLNIEKKSFLDEKSLELQEKTIELVKLSVKGLCVAWLNTIMVRSGKDMGEANITDNGDGVHVSDLSVDNISIKLVFITKKINDVSLLTNKDSLFISFVPVVQNIDENNCVDWNLPLEDSKTFLSLLREHSKKVGSDNFEFIDLPLGLKDKEKGEIIKLVRSFFSKVNYSQLNNVEEFKPELNDYMLSINQIDLGFKSLGGDIKIFVSLTENRMQFYVFQNGIKKISDNVYKAISLLRKQINQRSSSFMNIRKQVEASFLSETKKFVSILIPMIISTGASIGILLQDVSILQSVQSSRVFLGIHITFGFISIVLFIIFGIVPTIRSMLFSWEWKLNSKIKESNL